MLKELSKELSSLVQGTKNRLVHIGGKGISGRTGVIVEKGLVVTLARQAEDGETVSLTLSGDQTVASKVRAFDRRTGLTLLAFESDQAVTWKKSTLPEVGSLALTVAFASPQGVESRLDVVRFSGGKTAWGNGVEISGHFQTDGTPYPGFTGAVVLDPDGALLGFVVENRPGNEGFVIPAEDLFVQIEQLKKSGSRGRAYLGVNTQMTELTEDQEKAAGRKKAVLVTQCEKGSPAASVLAPGDLLLAIGGRDLEHPGALWEVLTNAVPGESLAVKVLRGNQIHEFSLIPAGR